MDTLISIIVPIYKVEEYLDRCVESLVNQTYSNIEILLIDDGSPDKCPQMCDEWALRDSRIKVFHKTNGGLSDARNYGLDRSSGDYISFVDSDDWVAADFIEVLVNNIEKEKADISIIGFTMIWENGKTRRFSEDNQYYIFNKDEAIRELFIQEKFYCMACQKLYKAKVFRSIRFPVGKLYEDVAISLPTFQMCDKVVVCGQSKYFYFQRNTSISGSKFSNGKLYFLECCKDMVQYSDSLGGKYDKEVHSFYLKALMMLLFQIYDSKVTSERAKLIDDFAQIIRNEQKYIWGNRYLPFKKKVVLLLMMSRFPESILLKLWKTR